LRTPRTKDTTRNQQNKLLKLEEMPACSKHKKQIEMRAEHIGKANFKEMLLRKTTQALISKLQNRLNSSVQISTRHPQGNCTITPKQSTISVEFGTNIHLLSALQNLSLDKRISSKWLNQGNLKMII